MGCVKNQKSPQDLLLTFLRDKIICFDKTAGIKAFIFNGAVGISE